MHEEFKHLTNAIMLIQGGVFPNATYETVGEVLHGLEKVRLPFLPMNDVPPLKAVPKNDDPA